MRGRVRFITAALFDIVELEPGLGEAERVLGIGEIVDDLLPLALEGACDVLQACVEGLLLSEASELGFLVTRHQGFEVALLAALDDGGGGEAEVPA
jgi:hypothetical protein